LEKKSEGGPEELMLQMFGRNVQPHTKGVKRGPIEAGGLQEIERRAKVSLRGTLDGVGSLVRQEVQ